MGTLTRHAPAQNPRTARLSSLAMVLLATVATSCQSGGFPVPATKTATLSNLVRLTPTSTRPSEGVPSRSPTSLPVTQTPIPQPLIAGTFSPTPPNAVAQMQIPNAHVLVWSPAGNAIAVRQNLEVLILDADSLVPTQKMDLGNVETHLLAIDPTGERVAAVDMGATLHVWEISSGRSLASRDDFINGLAYLDYSGDGTLYVADIYSGGSVGVFGLSSSLEAVDDGAGAYLQDFDFSDQPLVVSPVGNLVAAGQLGSGIQVYGPNQPDSKPALTITSPAVREMSFTPDGGQLVTIGEGCKFRIYDVTTGKEIQEFKWCEFNPGSTESFGLVISRNGRYAAAADGFGGLGVWDLETGARTAHLAVPKRGYNSLDFSPDGSKLASIGEDGLLQIWRIGQ